MKGKSLITRIAWGIASVALVAVGLAQGQQQQAPPTFETMIVNSWKAEHNKILEMAKDFPEDKYDVKPHPEARSFYDEVRHVTIGLEMSAAQLRGERFDYMARIEADKAKPKTRESLVGELESAMQVSFAEVEKKQAPALVFWVGHQSEHYGKLATLYRMNNLVPPATRRAQERMRQQGKQPGKQQP